MDLEAYWAEVIQDAVAYMQRASDMLGQLALIEERAHNVDQRTQEALALLAASIDRQAQTLSEILTSMRDEDPQDNL